MSITSQLLQPMLSIIQNSTQTSFFSIQRTTCKESTHALITSKNFAPLCCWPSLREPHSLIGFV